MKRSLWQPVLAGATFGACISIVFGLRSVDTLLNQDFYWLDLGLWITPGIALGAGSGLIYEMLRRD